jgi:serine phosphatase RsbU (regulator of sigma subunit)
MPGPRAEMTALAARWDPATFRLQISSCGHVAPLIIRADGDATPVEQRAGRGLGGRASPRPARRETSVEPGDRLVLCSDGVIHTGTGQAGLTYDAVASAALRADPDSAADTVHQVHREVLAASGDELRDDATVVCLAAA